MAKAGDSDKVVGVHCGQFHSDLLARALGLLEGVSVAQDGHSGVRLGLARADVHVLRRRALAMRVRARDGGVVVVVRMMRAAMVIV